MRFYTSSHLLSEMKSVPKDQGMTLAVNVTEKNSIQLESRRGLFQKTRLVPNGQTYMEMHASPNDSSSRWPVLDPDGGCDDESWTFARSRIVDSSKLGDFDRLRKATELCYAAVAFSDGRRRSNVEKALAMSPKYCAVAHYLKFELLVSDPNKFDHRESRSVDKAVEMLKQAVQAGRNTAELIQADSFCPGQLYSWIPTRWLVRSVYMLGAILLLGDRYDEADQAFKECMALDIHDKLGARHKQLLAVLERDGVQGDEIKWLLEAKFGVDQEIDDVYALFKYTRALRAFVDKGNCKRSRKLLEYAIEKNPFIPMILLGWEGIKTGPGEIMTLGTEMEAADYTEDNVKHWCCVDGAQDWLEEIYCKLKSVEPLTKNSEIRELLLEASMLIHDSSLKLHSPARKRIKTQALEKLERIEEIMQAQEATTSPSTNSRHKELELALYQRKGLCYGELYDWVKALPCFNTALTLVDYTNKDMVKELLYNRADCKQQSGDLAGALADYTFVYQRIGAFSTAVENIQQLERQLNVNSSVLPPPAPLPDVGVDGNEAKMRRAMDDLVKHMPTINLQDNLERCSHCQRGGMKLAGCSACKEDKFCSKQCQVAAWKAYHKYVCKGSKKRLDAGTKVTIQGLEKAPQHNGKSAIVVNFLRDKKRFAVKIAGEDEENEEFLLSLKPQNLVKEE